MSKPVSLKSLLKFFSEGRKVPGWSTAMSPEDYEVLDALRELEIELTKRQNKYRRMEQRQFRSMIADPHYDEQKGAEKLRQYAEEQIEPLRKQIWDIRLAIAKECFDLDALVEFIPVLLRNINDIVKVRKLLLAAGVNHHQVDTFAEKLAQLVRHLGA